MNERTLGLDPFSDEGFECLLQRLQEANVEVLDHSRVGHKKGECDYFCLDFESLGNLCVRVTCFNDGLITVGYKGICVNVHPQQMGRPTVEVLVERIVGFRMLGC